MVFQAFKDDFSYRGLELIYRFDKKTRPSVLNLLWGQLLTSMGSRRTQWLVLVNFFLCWGSILFFRSISSLLSFKAFLRNLIDRFIYHFELIHIYLGRWFPSKHFKDLFCESL